MPEEVVTYSTVLDGSFEEEPRQTVIQIRLILEDLQLFILQKGGIMSL